MFAGAFHCSGAGKVNETGVLPSPMSADVPEQGVDAEANPGQDEQRGQRSASTSA